MRILSKRVFFLFFLPLTLVLLAACSDGSFDAVLEEEEKTFRRAERLKKSGDYEDALLAFLKVIDNRKDAAESHLNAGLLFLEHRNEPIMAIYHFTKYLELKPTAEKADLVRQQIEAAKRQFIKSLPGRPFENDYERLDLLELVKQLKNENNALKEKLAIAVRERDAAAGIVRSPPSAVNNVGGSERSASGGSRPEGVPPASRPRTYVVQEQDTLSKISMKMYNTSARWMDIYRANRDTMANPDNLKPGQTLRIP